MEQNRLQNVGELKKVQQVAKLTISFITKHNIPLTPVNYDEWFYVICRALEDNHVLSENNLRILYQKYRQDFQSLEEVEKKEIKEVSQSLKEVTESSGTMLDSFDRAIEEHSGLIGESIEAIDAQDSEKMAQLRSKIESLEEENKKLKTYLEKNRRKLEAIEAKFAQTKKEADIDALTQVFNRQRFNMDIEKFEKSCDTYSVIFLDIDDFKKINDTFGHAVGDRVLKEVGEILTNYLRRNTYAYRYGGEEFVVVLPEGSLEAAKVVANRLKEVIENRAIKIDKHKMFNFTASFGATQKMENEQFEDVLKRADEALYEAKRSGKNRVVLK